ncbi:hypothetical protein AUG19_02310 [archaeon 13_1_20CM_2_54_9]|nr:MAG: hypothetical protein AUG19_02310 [archaeon 13_1_20CM_2_54_9]
MPKVHDNPSIPRIPRTYDTEFAEKILQLLQSKDPKTRAWAIFIDNEDGYYMHRGYDHGKSFTDEDAERMWDFIHRRTT